MKTVIAPWPPGWEGRPTLTLCVNVRKEEFVQSCGRRGAFDIRAVIEGELARRGLDIDFQTIACLGRCAKGPNVRIAPSNTWFHQITPADVPELLDTLEREMTAPATPAAN